MLLDFKPERRTVIMDGELKFVYVCVSEMMQREAAPVFYNESTAREIAYHMNVRHDFFRALPHVPLRTSIPRPVEVHVSGDYPREADLKSGMPRV